MTNPVALFAIPSSDVAEKIIQLRQNIRNLGYDSGKTYIDTLPHLTLAVVKDLTADPEDIKKHIQVVLSELPEFFIPANKVIAIDNNIALSFDNTYSKELAEKISKQLEKFGFEIVVTDFMKIIRSEVNKKHQETVIKMVEEQLPKQLKITQIALAGKLLREEDLLWNIPLKS